jgi:hypothetical protein
MMNLHWIELAILWRLASVPERKYFYLGVPELQSVHSDFLERLLAG